MPPPAPTPSRALSRTTRPKRGTAPGRLPPHRAGGHGRPPHEPRFRRFCRRRVAV